MKIEKYTKLAGNRYNVKIDEETIKLYDDVIIKYELLRKKEISDELFNEIIKYNDSLDAYYKALRYITKKMRTIKEVENYLKADYTNKTIQETIQKLEKQGFLNKEKYLKSYIADHVNLSLIGPNKIKNNLLKLGFNEEEFKGQIENIEKSVWLEKIRKAVKKKITNNKSYGTNKLKEKILYDLTNLGFDKGMVEEVINETTFKDNDDIIKKEYNKAKASLAKKYEGIELENKILAKLLSKGFYYEDIKKLFW